MKNIGFTLIGGSGWVGGKNYLRNLLLVLATQQPSCVNCILFVGDDVKIDDIKDFKEIPNLQIIITPLLQVKRKFLSFLQALIIGYDHDLIELFKSYKVDYIFESAIFFGWRTRIRVIAWIPDLQHKFLPHLFSFGSLIRREVGIWLQIYSGRIIMLSSNDAKKHFFQYYKCKNKVKVVQFSVPYEGKIDSKRVEEIRKIYQLPKNYFYVPNQLWAHKNHLIIVDALSILKKSNAKVVVVCTGEMNDLRNHQYAVSFFEKYQKAEIKDTMLLLGLVPFEHVKILMQASEAIINPSLFEGWSTTVEEAKSMGISMILSNIEVHHEQAGAQAQYFSPHSPGELAEILKNFERFKKFQVTPHESTLKSDSISRVQRYAEDFIDIL